MIFTDKADYLYLSCRDETWLTYLFNTCIFALSSRRRKLDSASKRTCVALSNHIQPRYKAISRRRIYERTATHQLNVQNCVLKPWTRMSSVSDYSASVARSFPYSLWYL